MSLAPAEARPLWSGTLPWPPSVNGYWRSPNRGPLAGRTLISVEGRKFRLAAVAALLAQGRPLRPLTVCLRVEVHVWPPDRRRRDLDNLAKPVLDALTHGNVISDDSLIDDLRLVRMEPVRDGRIGLSIWAMTA